MGCESSDIAVVEALKLRDADGVGRRWNYGRLRWSRCLRALLDDIAVRSVFKENVAALIMLEDERKGSEG